MSRHGKANGYREYLSTAVRIDLFWQTQGEEPSSLSNAICDDLFVYLGHHTRQCDTALRTSLIEYRKLFVLRKSCHPNMA